MIKIKRHSNATRKYLANIIREDQKFYNSFVQSDWFGFFCGFDKFDPYNLYVAIDTTLDNPEPASHVKEQVIDDRTKLWIVPYPKRFIPSVVRFWEGKYSQMYNIEDIMKLFGDTHLLSTREVLIKSPDLQARMESELGLIKGTLDNLDLDSKPDPKKELFINYLKIFKDENSTG